MFTIVVPEESPVRLAHRVKELDELPHQLSAMTSLKIQRAMHINPRTSWQELISLPPIFLPPASAKHS